MLWLVRLGAYLDDIVETTCEMMSADLCHWRPWSLSISCTDLGGADHSDQTWLEVRVEKAVSAMSQVVDRKPDAGT